MPNYPPSNVAVWLGALASLTSVGAGVHLLTIRAANESSILESMAHGIGAYFIAKAFVLGPGLYYLAKCSRAAG